MEQTQPVTHTVYDKIRQRVAWFVTPHATIANPSERRRVQALLALLGLCALISVMSILIFSMRDRSIGLGATISTLISVLLYLIARWVSYRAGAVIAIGGILLIPYMLYIAGSSAFSLLLLFNSMLMTMFVSMLLPALSVTVLTVVVNVGIAGVFFFAAPDFSSAEIIQFMSAFGLMSAFLLGAAYVINADVQQVRQQSDELQSSADRFQALLSVVPEAIVVLIKGEIVYANALAATSLGYSTADEIVGQYLHTTSTDSVTSRMRRNKQHGSFTVQSEDTFYIDEAHPFTAEATATPITYDGQMAIFLLLRPLDEATTHLMQAAFQQMPDPTCIVSLTTPQPMIVYANPALCELKGVSSQALEGTPAAQVYQHIADIERVTETLRAGDSINRQTTYQHSMSEALPIQIHATPVYDSQGELTHGIIILRDVSRVKHLRDKLQEREERYLTLANLMSDYAYGLSIKDGNERFEWITGSVSDLIGRSPDEVSDYAGWEDLLHEEDKPLYQLRQHAVLAGETSTEEYRLLQPDGTVRWVQDTARPIYDDDGTITHIYGAAHDITERVKAQEALKTHVVQQAVVAELGLLAMSHQDEFALQAHTVVLVEQVLQIDVCNIFAHYPEDELLRLVATTSQVSIPHEAGIPDSAEASLGGYTLQANEPVVIDDYRTAEGLSTYNQMSEAGYRSGVSLTIQGREQPYGVMSVHTKDKRAFSEDDIYFLQSVANVIGTFIERSRAQRAEHEQRELTEALREASIIINSQLELPIVLEKIQEFVAKLVPSHEFSSILLVDATAGTYEIASRRNERPRENPPPLGTTFKIDNVPFIREIIDSGKTQVITDADDNWITIPGLEWITSSLAAPIIVQERCIGVLSLSSSQRDAFTQQHTDMLQTFAEKTGNAIINARRAEELERLVKERTAELKREREQLQTILDSTGEGIFYAENRQIRYVNQALLDMTGYTTEDFNNAKTGILLPDDEPRKTTLARRIEIRQYVQQGLTWRNEHRIQRKDGSTFDAGLTVTRVGEADDGVQAVTIVRDISDAKELERQKERFIDHAAHELRSPVTSLNTRIYLIRKKADGFAEHLHHLERISNRMNRLASDLLDLSSFEKGHIVLRKESIVLQNILTDTIDMYGPEANMKMIALSLDAPDKPVQVLVDPHRMQQVFTNLVTNAIHYTPEDGEITLCCRTDADNVCIDIHDTGPGITEEDLAHIFQPFYRATKDKQGTGLGLSIAKEITELHGGSLTVSSVLGEGSTFTVCLPLIDE